MPTVRLQYFAILKDKRGIASETLETEASNPLELYEHLQSLHGFPLSAKNLRVAINGDFSRMDHPLRENDEVVYIPPVAGG
jgi:molybdopterin synthase sulfur carrier subunit